jgi:hypothetical protein
MHPLRRDLHVKRPRGGGRSEPRWLIRRMLRLSRAPSSKKRGLPWRYRESLVKSGKIGSEEDARGMRRTRSLRWPALPFSQRRRMNAAEGVRVKSSGYSPWMDMGHSARRKPTAIAVAGTGRAAHRAVLKARAPRISGSTTKLGREETRSAVARLKPVRMEVITGSVVGDTNPARTCIVWIAARYGRMDVPVMRPSR